MRAELGKRWESRSPRERLVVIMLGVLVAVVLYAWLIRSADRARIQLRQSVAQLRFEAARLEKQADEIARLRATRPASRQEAAPQADFRQIVQSQVDAGGLTRALLRIEQVDAAQVRVVFGAVPFSEWLAWVEGLQMQQIRVDAARIEALSAPGLVSVTALFVRPGR